MPHLIRVEETGVPDKQLVVSRWYNTHVNFDGQLVQELLAIGAIEVDAIPELSTEDAQKAMDYSLYFNPQTKQLWYEGIEIITAEDRIKQLEAENARLSKELETEQLSNKTMTGSFDGLVACLTEKGFI